MSLRDYARKRRFDGTPEPEGHTAARASRRPIFVVQLHHASSRHYDFRLEMDGVLKSWAVPKGPSLRAGEKRLAVEVEDHPLDYATFEGDIPKGHYGAGHVDVFDHGHWACDGDPLQALAAGKLDFTLSGDRLVGGWKLVRTNLRGKQPQWLLIKRSDAHAADTDADALVDAAPAGAKGVTRRASKPTEGPGKTAKSATSAKSATKKVAAEKRVTPRRDAAAPRKAPSKWHTRALAATQSRDGHMPVGFAPSLATLRAIPPAGDGWLHELKWDGYRLLVDLVDGVVKLRSRGGLDWNTTFPEVVKAVQQLPVSDACLDGELVVLDAEGRSDFSELQRVIDGTSNGQLRYLVFDLPGLAGVDLTRTPLIERKALLKALLGTKTGILAYSDHVVGHGAEVFEQTKAQGLEGVVSKHVDSSYHGGRGGDWIKSKHALSDDFIVVGYTAPKGARDAFGSLLMATKDADGLRYVGRVGTGFDAAALTRIHAQLCTRERKTAVVELPDHVPFAARSVHWVSPTLVAEVAYRGWAKEGLLRQASFLRMRSDKSADEVDAGAAATGATMPNDASSAKTRARRTTKTSSPRTAAADTSKRSSKTDAQAADTGSSRITHPDRIVFDGATYTKQDVADYYRRVAKWLLPELVERPLSVVRCPDGSQKACFFQKHYADSLGASVRSIALRQKSGTEQYLFVDDIDGVIDLVQMGMLELHPWGATTSAPEKPDRLVFDLDPGDGVTWKATVAAARDVRAKLDEAGLQSFVRLSGGKGLHVVVPIDPGPDWDDVRTFCEAFAQAMAAHAPDTYVATMSKAKRPGRIFIDWLRNARGATSVASWSLRARPGAPVAVPLRWEDLGRITRPGQFDLAAAKQRASRLRTDPWKGFATLRQGLPDLG